MKGYINVNPYGGYSKHYYADADCIASKIGDGSEEQRRRKGIGTKYESD